MDEKKLSLKELQEAVKFDAPIIALAHPEWMKDEAKLAVVVEVIHALKGEVKVEKRALVLKGSWKGYVVTLTGMKGEHLVGTGPYKGKRLGVQVRPEDVTYEIPAGTPDEPVSKKVAKK